MHKTTSTFQTLFKLTLISHLAFSLIVLYSFQFFTYHVTFSILHHTSQVIPRGLCAYVLCFNVVPQFSIGLPNTFGHTFHDCNYIYTGRLLFWSLILSLFWNCGTFLTCFFCWLAFSKHVINVMRSNWEAHLVSICDTIYCADTKFYDALDI